MHTSIEMLDAVRRRHGLPSDYAASKIIGCTRASVSRIRQEKGHFGPETALKIADLLSIDPAYVLACVEAERAQSAQVRAAWEGLAGKLGSGLAASLVAVGLALPAAVQAADFVLCQVRKRLLVRQPAALAFA